MPKIHAVLYSMNGAAWIAISDWSAGGAGGITRVDDLEADLADEMRKIADEQLDRGHRLVPENADAPADAPFPKLVILEHDGILYVARGFEPWGSVVDDAVKVRLVTTADDATGGEVAQAGIVAGLLRHIGRSGRGGTQDVVDLLRLEDAGRSVAFATQGALAGTTMPGGGIDFSNAADG